jgi:hypothetical protein
MKDFLGILDLCGLCALCGLPQDFLSGQHRARRYPQHGVTPAADHGGGRGGKQVAGFCEMHPNA